jgi:hypothetical protein
MGRQAPNLFVTHVDNQCGSILNPRCVRGVMASSWSLSVVRIGFPDAPQVRLAGRWQGRTGANAGDFLFGTEGEWANLTQRLASLSRKSGSPPADGACVKRLRCGQPEKLECEAECPRCCLCLDSMVDSAENVALPCRHEYHCVCLCEWLLWRLTTFGLRKEPSRAPACRTALRPSSNLRAELSQPLNHCVNLIHLFRWRFLLARGCGRC